MRMTFKQYVEALGFLTKLVGRRLPAGVSYGTHGTRYRVGDVDYIIDDGKITKEIPTGCGGCHKGIIWTV